MKDETKFLIGAAAFYFFFLRRKPGAQHSTGLIAPAEAERIHLASMGAPSDYPIALDALAVQDINNARAVYGRQPLDTNFAWLVNSDGTISRAGWFE